MAFQRQPSPKRAELPKNTILTEAGRSPWYNSDGKPAPAYIIGIGGGSASGKTRVAQAILKQLNVPWVVVVAQDNFYKPLNPEQSKKAFENNYDFDSPDAFDYDILKKCILDLKSCKAVQIPNYSFVLHQRTADTTYLYGATVCIIEGIFALHDPEIRDLLDLKIFVQCDSDLMLARRLRRDLVERGRDAGGVLDQYLRFVKPSLDLYVQPTSKHADIIVHGERNEIAINLVTSHIRRQLDERKVELRKDLFREVGVADHSDVESDRQSLDGAGKEPLPPSVVVLEQTRQIRGIHTILRDRTTPNPSFIFHADRISTLVIEFALSLLPYRAVPIMTGTQLPYTGQELDVPLGHLCGVSILRSGASLEIGLRRVLRDAPVGSMLVQSDVDTGEPLLYDLSLPSCITLSSESASKAWVLLLDSQIGTGAAALMGVRVLLDHGVKEDHIIFCCILASRKGGVWALNKAFPKVRVVTSAVDDGLEERWTWPKDPTARDYQDALKHEPKNGDAGSGPKKIFAITPGLGSFGERYFGS